MERSSNREFVRNANGKVLIAGLGIGLIIHNILEKENVSHITVIEKHKDVIDLVSPYFKSKKITFICADILEWLPPVGEKFDIIYFDIWPTICGDNMKEISMLHNRFKNKLNRSNPDCWMDSWMKKRCQADNRPSRSYW
jgi:hypothetical protein